MPSINPLLYSDESENEILAAPDAAPLAPPKLGAFAGFGKAVATTASNTAQAVWASGKEAVERAITGDAYDKLQERAALLNSPKMEKIDPLTTGAAAQVLAPLMVDLPVTVASLGVGSFGAAARERLTTYQDLLDQGVDVATARATANEKGLETGLTYSLTRIPGAKALGAIESRALRWGAKAAVGAGVMTGIDFAGGETRGAILEAHGYKEQADQMRHWDAMRFASDAIGGALLGVTTRSPVSDEVAASRWWIQGADDLQHESGPGLPTTPQASGATADATIKAVNDIRDGNPVNVADTPGLFDHDFLHYVPGRDEVAAGKRVAALESELEKITKRHEGLADDIKNAREQGYHDEADYFQDEVMPTYAAQRTNYERLVDQARDELDAIRNPERVPPHEELARPSLTEHAEDLTAIRAKAEEFRNSITDTTPGAMADKGTMPPVKRDVVTEAREMLNNYRNPVAQGIEGAEAGAAPKVKLSPEDQELVNMHQELRDLATRNNDPDLHAELDEAMQAHAAEHLEAGKFNVAALCAIG